MPGYPGHRRAARAALSLELVSASDLIELRLDSLAGRRKELLGCGARAGVELFMLLPRYRYD